MSTLQNFLIEASKDETTKDIFISPRLKDWKFKIRAMRNDEYKRWQKLCVTQKNGKRNFDDARMKMLIVTECTLEPNFKDVKFLQDAGCATPEQGVEKLLLPGEIERVAGEVSILSGFGEQLEEAVEEAKND